MSFKLSKQEIAQCRKFIEAITGAAGDLEEAVETFNAKLEELRGPLKEAIDAYNKAVQDARGFCEDIANQADEAINEKSEKWQDGEKGQQAIAWKDAYQNADFEDAEFELPDDLRFEHGTEENVNAETLGNLPDDAASDEY